MLLATTLACDDQALRVSREAADRQASQNQTMADLQQEVAAGARSLVEEEGQARRQALAIHQDLRAERVQLAAGWNQLEAERQKISRQRRTDGFWSSAAPALGATAVALLALSFAWIVLTGIRRDDDSAAVACTLLLDGAIPEDGQSVLPLLPGGSRSLLLPQEEPAESSLGGEAGSL